MYYHCNQVSITKPTSIAMNLQVIYLQFLKTPSHSDQSRHLSKNMVLKSITILKGEVHKTNQHLAVFYCSESAVHNLSF